MKKPVIYFEKELSAQIIFYIYVYILALLRIIFLKAPFSTGKSYLFF